MCSRWLGGLCMTLTMIGVRPSFTVPDPSLHCEKCTKDQDLNAKGKKHIIIKHMELPCCASLQRISSVVSMVDNTQQQSPEPWRKRWLKEIFHENVKNRSKQIWKEVYMYNTIRNPRTVDGMLITNLPTAGIGVDALVSWSYDDRSFQDFSFRSNLGQQHQWVYQQQWL